MSVFYLYSKHVMEGPVDGEWQEGGKNRWRYQVGSDQKICEIELTQGKVALIDAARLPDVLPHRWRLRTSYKDVFYARTTFCSPEKNVTIDMHVHLFPEIIAPRDHIDRNGLNNTRVNLRSGAHGINERNRRTDKDDIGIIADSRGYGYRAVWTNTNGKIRKAFKK